MAGIWVRGQQLKDVKQAERLKLDSLKVQECRSTKARQFLLMIFVQKNLSILNKLADSNSMV